MEMGEVFALPHFLFFTRLTKFAELTNSKIMVNNFFEVLLK
jgi:hypothetical protein